MSVPADLLARVEAARRVIAQDGAGAPRVRPGDVVAVRLVGERVTFSARCVAVGVWPSGVVRIVTLDGEGDSAAYRTSVWDHDAWQVRGTTLDRDLSWREGQGAGEYRYLSAFRDAERRAWEATR